MQIDLTNRNDLQELRDLAVKHADRAKDSWSPAFSDLARAAHRLDSMVEKSETITQSDKSPDGVELPK